MYIESLCGFVFRYWIIAVACVSVVFGLYMWGYIVIHTVG